MKNKILMLLSVVPFITLAQVGVNTLTPTPGSILDIQSTDKGLLIPRLDIVDLTTIAPVTGGSPNGLLAYNTNTTSGVGLYYWNGTRWNAVGSERAWALTGNAGTTASNYIGTTDTQPLRLSTNATTRLIIPNANQIHANALGTQTLPFYSFAADTNTGIYSSGTDQLALSTAGLQRMMINATGNVGINTAPTAFKLDVFSGGFDAIHGRSNNVGGTLGHETNITLGVPAQTLLGAGVYANNPAAGYTSIYAQSTAAANVAASISYSTVWMGSYNYVQNGSATYNPLANYNQLNVTNASLPGFQSALMGFSGRGTTSGNPGYTVGVRGIADTQNQDSFAVIGQSFTNSTTRAGGYFEANNYAGVNQAFAYVGSSVGLNRKITGTNAVSEIVPTVNHGRITLTAPESPEYWYQDYGTVEMVNGRAHVELDPILSDITVIDKDNPIRAFFTPQEMLYFNGATIVNQTATGFDIVELNGGTNSGKIQYQIIVRPKTGYGEGRFPQAPGPAYLKADKEPLAAKAKNQVDPSKIFYWPADHIVYKYNPEDHIAIGDIVPAGPNAGKTYLGNGKYGEGLPATQIKNE